MIVLRYLKFVYGYIIITLENTNDWVGGGGYHLKVVEQIKESENISAWVFFFRDNLYIWMMNVNLSFSQFTRKALADVNMFFHDISRDLSHIKNILYTILKQNGSLSKAPVYSKFYNRVSLTLNGDKKKTVGLSMVLKKRVYGEERKLRRTVLL